jgi:hypothetical protein
MDSLTQGLKAARSLYASAPDHAPVGCEVEGHCIVTALDHARSASYGEMLNRLSEVSGLDEHGLIVFNATHTTEEVLASSTQPSRPRQNLNGLLYLSHMGYDRHHIITVTTYNADLAFQAHGAAREIFAQCIERQGELVTPIRTGLVNDWHTFVVTPDGSKEGWGTSDQGDNARAMFVAWLESHRFEDGSSPFDWAEVQYGDDCKETKVVRHSDEPVRRLLDTNTCSD